MTDYDQYKLQNPDDDAEERERRLPAEDPGDKADRLYQAYKEGDLDRPDIDRVRRK